jgi:hypothetical protein
MAEPGPGLQKIMSENAKLIRRYNDYMEMIRVGERKKARDEQQFKEKGYTGPYSPEMWAAANARYSSGIPIPKPRFPIILNDALTLQKVREIVGDALVSTELEWISMPQYEFEGEDDTEYQPQRFQYCVIEGHGSSLDLENHFDSDQVTVWFEGERRYAVLAHREIQETETSKTRFPIILNDVLTIQKVREIVGDALISNEIGWTTTRQRSYADDDEGYQPQRVQYCVVEGWGLRQDIEKSFSLGKVLVHFEGVICNAVLAHEEREATEDY